MPTALPYTSIGTRYRQIHQLSLSPSIDVLVTPSKKVTPFFFSGSRDVLSSSVPELQSANVTTGGARDKLVGVGTCWDEFKIGYFRKPNFASAKKAPAEYSMRE